jgi:hypothetical protein
LQCTSSPNSIARFFFGLRLGFESESAENRRANGVGRFCAEQGGDFAEGERRPMKLTVLTSAVHGLDAAHVELFRHIDNNGVCEVRG